MRLVSWYGHLKVSEKVSDGRMKRVGGWVGGGGRERERERETETETERQRQTDRETDR